jgi:hypothetical protein
MSVAVSGTAAAQANVMVKTTASSTAIPYSKPGSLMSRVPRPELLIAWLLVMLIAMAGSSHRRRSVLTYAFALLVILYVAMTLSACGGGGTTPSMGTPAGSYSLTVNGTFTSGSTTVTRNTNLTLIVQ